MAFLPHAAGTAIAAGLNTLKQFSLNPILQKIPNVEQLLKEVDMAANSVYFWSPTRGLGFMMEDAKVDVSLKNTIIKTPLTGRNGTVKELISAEDYKVVITGHVIGPLNNSPSFLVPLLAECLKEKGHIQVASKTLVPYLIFKLVLEKYEINQSKSPYVNVLDVNMEFWSDRDIDLKNV